MAHAFKLPDLGEGLTEGEVARWLVSEGQEIAEDDALVEIQTDKATVEIPSPYAGTVLEIRVAEGEIAPVGAVLVVIGAPGETVAEAPVARARGRCCTGTSRSGGSRVAATPLVRKIAQELGVDLAIGDRQRAGRAHDGGGRARGGRSGPGAEGRREPLRGIRRLTAEHMARAHREIPPVTWVEECDFEAVELERLLATVAKAVVDALPDFPELNARLEGDAIVYLDRYDLGIAVQTDGRSRRARSCAGPTRRPSTSSAPSSRASPRPPAQARCGPRRCAARRSRSRARASSQGSSRRRS